MWESLKKVHGALGQGRLKFFQRRKRRFFNYQAGSDESIDNVSSNLTRWQMTIRDFKRSKVPTDLDVALTLINSIEEDAYNLAK